MNEQASVPLSRMARSLPNNRHFLNSSICIFFAEFTSRNNGDIKCMRGEAINCRIKRVKVKQVSHHLV